MERILMPTDTDEVLAAAIGIFSLPRPIEKVDALVSIPGQREHCRVVEPIRWWQERESLARFLLVAGQNERERTKENLDAIRLEQPPFNLSQTEGLVLESRAKHTKDQADWVAKHVKGKGITSIALFAAPYHLLRVYLTQLKSLEKAGIIIPIIPAPCTVDMENSSPEIAVSMWDMIPGEARRIKAYQKKGDVATLPELRAYLSWLHLSKFLQ